VIGGCTLGDPHGNEGLRWALEDITKFARSGRVFSVENTRVAIGMEFKRAAASSVNITESFPEMDLLLGKDEGRGLLNLAACRNRILQLAREREAKWMLMIDLDFMVGGTGLTGLSGGIVNALATWSTQGWNAATSHEDASGTYYDWWAFRVDWDANLNFDCWMSPRAGAEKKGCYNFVAPRGQVVVRRLSSSLDSTVSVSSAYNGLALYHVPSLGTCMYDTAASHHPELPPKEVHVEGYPGLPDFNASYCEHVGFHRCIGKVVIHRSLVSPVIGGKH